jgi:fimbrial chaperone protein
MSRIRTRLAAVAGAMAASLLPVALAVGGSFNVSPVRVELSAQNRTQALTVRNDGAEPSVVQVQLYEWSQSAGQDILSPTAELLVSPPVFTVQPGQSQLLRVALRKEPDAARQLSYRAVLQEVPAQGRAGGPALNVALKISLPIFVEPRVEATPALDWQARIDGGKLAISAHNGGNGHIQLGDFTLSDAQGRTLATQPQVSYILPGQTRSWTLEAGADLASVDRVRLTGRSDAGDVATEIALAR